MEDSFKDRQNDSKELLIINDFSSWYFDIISSR